MRKVSIKPSMTSMNSRTFCDVGTKGKGLLCMRVAVFLLPSLEEEEKDEKDEGENGKMDQIAVGVLLVLSTVRIHFICKAP